jgi:ubiquinol-cytochrome c reductase iron-sulfur subunit
VAGFVAQIVIEFMDMKTDSSPRMSLLSIVTVVTLFIGIVMAISGLVQPLLPGAVKSEVAGVVVRLGGIQPGETKTISFEGNPVIIRRLTPGQLAEAKLVDLAALRDQSARNPNIVQDAMATVGNRIVDTKDTFVVAWGVCAKREWGVLVDGGDFGGWYCNNSAAHFDVLGRIRKGENGENLSIPRYSLIDEDTLVLLPDQRLPSEDELERLLYGRKLGS